jgi:hypothetical protein
MGELPSDIPDDFVPRSVAKDSQRAKWRIRFTVRDLFWLTLVAALGIAWWLDLSQLQSRCLKLENLLHRGGGFGARLN